MYLVKITSQELVNVAINSMKCIKNTCSFSPRDIAVFVSREVRNELMGFWGTSDGVDLNAESEYSKKYNMYIGTIVEFPVFALEANSIPDHKFGWKFENDIEMEMPVSD